MLEAQSPLFQRAGTKVFDHDVGFRGQPAEYLRTLLGLAMILVGWSVLDGTLWGAALKIFGFVPLVGAVGKNMTEVHVDVSGLVDKPEMHILPAAGLTKGVEDQAKEIGEHIKDIFKRHSHHQDERAAE